jgi:hypothetical protein
VLGEGDTVRPQEVGGGGFGDVGLLGHCNLVS